MDWGEFAILSVLRIRTRHDPTRSLFQSSVFSFLRAISREPIFSAVRSIQWNQLFCVNSNSDFQNARQTSIRLHFASYESYRSPSVRDIHFSLHFSHSKCLLPARMLHTDCGSSSSSSFSGNTKGTDLESNVASEETRNDSTKESIIQ